jgi:hypothetical protein
LGRDDAEHDRHDRRRPVHYYSPDHRCDGRAASNAGWIFGAVLVVCDGLVWAELGASLPGSGGSYRYLSEIYGPRGFGA